MKNIKKVDEKLNYIDTLQAHLRRAKELKQQAKDKIEQYKKINGSNDIILFWEKNLKHAELRIKLWSKRISDEKKRRMNEKQMQGL